MHIPSLAGRYEIQGEIGAGGMATVYLARDVRHDRRVALKVLDPDLTSQLGPERFLAEIRVTAGLQHPNILPLFDSGEAHEPGAPEGSRLLYYVMPYVDGESLRARLTRERQLPVDEALHIALAVARALQYAHERGVVHRDVKPENILLQAGQPVVADFGIALAVSNAGGTRLTRSGLSLGTPQYMSPEQAAAERTIDGRSDVYSLAAVLYEMLTGDPPHTGSTAQAVIARVLTEKSRAVRATRSSVPPHVDAAVARALEKLPADRFATAAEFAAALQGPGVEATAALQAQGARGGEESSAPLPRAARAWLPRRSTGAAALLAAALLAAGAIVGAVAMRTRGAAAGSPGDAPAVRATIALPADAPLALANLPPVGFNGDQLALSPDGTALVYVAATANGNALYVRDLATGDARALAGTEGAKVAVFSPDGAWIAFATGDHIRKVPRAGGAVTDLCAASSVRIWWPDQRFVYFDPEAGLLSRVSADGGKADSVATAQSLGGNAFSDVLPGGTAALLDVGRASIAADHGDVMFADLTTHRTQVLVRGGFAARYAPDGYLIFARAGALFGLRFDARRGAVSGEPVAIASGVSMETAFAMLQASAARGVLAFAPGADVSRGKMAWVDRRGRVDFIPAPELVYGEVDLAPDDRHIAVHVADVQDYLWIWDLERREGQRVAFPEAEGYPRWSADGRRLAGNAIARGQVVLHDVAGTGLVGAGTLLPDSARATEYFSPAGDVLAVSQAAAHFQSGFVGLRPGAPKAPPVAGVLVTFSPDGKWIAYTTAANGIAEVFLRSFPDGRDAGQVSHGGGIEPRWKPDGTLYYRNGHRWYETKVTTNPEPRWERPRLAFDVEFSDTQGWSYDVSRDGQRLLVVKRVQPIETGRIELIANWTKLFPRTQ